MKFAIICLLLCGCAHQKPAKIFATPDCTRLKEPCEIKDGKLHNCKLILACTEVGK